MTASQRGTLFVAISAALYSIGGLCIKVIPWNGMSINGGRTAIALVVIGAYLLWTKHPLRLNRWVALGALSVFGTNALFSLANKLTTAANAIVLQFTVPIFVMLFSALFFRKKPQKLDLAACAVVLGGILFFFLDSLEMGGGLGNFLALLSGVSYAGVFLMNDMPDSDAISSVFWGDVLSAVTGLPFLAHETEFTATAVFSLVILGAFQVGVAYVLLCIGLKTTPPVTASLISGIEPVLNPILVAIFYKEAIGAYAMVGAAIVIGGVVAYNVLKLKLGAKAQHSNIPISQQNEDNSHGEKKGKEV
ncbi:putative DMT superfamily transporter inner membrane protein [uncultured Clostridium sp.]|jgi:drug/metabolite transporter (DMT)-like permease|uniref:DMT family transporter n=1 Tax=Flintibacter sp. P01028 TaxID=3342382 RepID=UPI0008226858|nr:putative DMT superfamily transporter inner membrane protein [uncultured Clostridium sp.]